MLRGSFVLVLSGLCGAALPQATATPFPGLLHRWTLDETAGLTADDAVGPRDGAHTNGPGIVTADLPPVLFSNPAALSFGGTDQRVVVAGGLQDVLGGTASLTFWIRTTQTAATPHTWESPGVTGVEESGGGNDIFWGFLDDAGRIGVQAGNGAAAKSARPINDGTWHHVALTRDGPGGQVQCFVDGVLDAAATSEAGAKTTAFADIGRIADTGGYHDYFSGLLDDLRIYNRVLTLAEVQVLASGGDGLTAPPPAPTGLSAVAGPGQAQVSWNPVSGAAGYTVLVATAAGGPYVPAATVHGAAYATVTELVNFTEHYFVVAAFNEGGVGPTSASASAIPFILPRENDHTEGLVDDRCACGSVVPPGIPALGLLAAFLGLLAFRRRA